jgi:hypothetical protein
MLTAQLRLLLADKPGPAELFEFHIFGEVDLNLCVGLKAHPQMAIFSV